MLDTRPPAAVEAIAEGLQYRDFITVGLDVERLRLGEGRLGRTHPRQLDLRPRARREGRPDPDLQQLVARDGRAIPTRTWVGLEYFCARGDELWNLDGRRDDRVRAAASSNHSGAIRRGEARDGVVLRVPRTYPAYFGTYPELGTVRAWLEQLSNLWLSAATECTATTTRTTRCSPP